MKWVKIDVGKGTVDVNDNITEGDLNSSGIKAEGFPESWKDKIVNAVFYKGKESVDVVLGLNADKDRFTGTIPPQMLAEDGSFKVVIYAVSAEQVDEPYKDVRPAVWAEVKDGLESAEVLPMDKDVGAYLTLLIDLQNKEASIDEMIERLGDIEAIKNKLDSVADGAEVNVQADWAETDPKSDAFIPNKPDLAGMEERLREEISLTNDVAINAEASADANKDALDQHRANGDEGVNHLTDEEKLNVGKIEGIASDVSSLTLNEIPQMWRFINNNSDTISELTAPPVTDIPTTLEPNRAYNFGITENITLSFPSNANDGDVIYVGFQSLGTLNLVVDTTNTYDFELIPEMNTGYEIYAKYMVILGVGKWIVKYSEYAGV